MDFVSLKSGFHRKLIYMHDVSKAAIIIMDPKLTVGVPSYATATCGIDVFTHALEAFTSEKQNPYSDAIGKLAAWLYPIKF